MERTARVLSIARSECLVEGSLPNGRPLGCSRRPTVAPLCGQPSPMGSSLRLPQPGDGVPAPRQPWDFPSLQWWEILRVSWQTERTTAVRPMGPTEAWLPCRCHELQLPAGDSECLKLRYLPNQAGMAGGSAASAKPGNSVLLGERSAMQPSRSSPLLAPFLQTAGTLHT